MRLSAISRDWMRGKALGELTCIRPVGEGFDEAGVGLILRNICDFWRVFFCRFYVNLPNNLKVFADLWLDNFSSRKWLICSD